MIQVLLQDLISAMENLNHRKTLIEESQGASQKALDYALSDLLERLSPLENYADLLELTETLGRCQHFKSKIQEYFEYAENTSEAVPNESLALRNEVGVLFMGRPEIISEIEGIQKALKKELNQRVFAFIPSAKSMFFERDDLFGKEVFQLASNEISGEIKLAGNCLAGDLNTAAVFHLMRVAELGMRALARRLKVKLNKNPIDFAGWTEIIKGINDAIAIRWDRLPKADKKARKKATDFLKACEVASDELNVFKEIWRNNVMHTSSFYGESDALGVLERVRNFTQRLAKIIPLK